MNELLWEQACWLLLSFRCRLAPDVINTIIHTWCQQWGRTLLEFFAADIQEWQKIGTFDEKTLQKLQSIHNDRPHSGYPETWPALKEQFEVVKQLAYDSISILTRMDAHYPTQLFTDKSLKHVPPVLFYAGDLHILKRLSFAIIGSRHADDDSIYFAREVARCLTAQQANVISGYARGIDRAVFEGATGTGGYTTVVLSHGINQLSNDQFYRLLPKIEAGQVLLLSQFHPHTLWHVGRSVERNKFVTGLAQVMIVAEVQINGGTWHSALGILEQRRPLYAYQPLQITPYGQLANSFRLPGNIALLERGACPLYWNAENRELLAEELAPLLVESAMLQADQYAMLSLPQQVAVLLKEHQSGYHYS